MNRFDRTSVGNQAGKFHSWYVAQSLADALKLIHFSRNPADIPVRYDGSSQLRGVFRYDEKHLFRFKKAVLQIFFSF